MAEPVPAQGISMHLPSIGGKYMSSRSDRNIIRRYNTRYLKKTLIFGIKVPMRVEEALASDKKKCNTMANPIVKEMSIFKIF